MIGLNNPPSVSSVLPHSHCLSVQCCGSLTTHCDGWLMALSADGFIKPRAILNPHRAAGSSRRQSRTSCFFLKSLKQSVCTQSEASGFIHLRSVTARRGLLDLLNLSSLPLDGQNDGHEALLLAQRKIQCCCSNAADSTSLVRIEIIPWNTQRHLTWQGLVLESVDPWMGRGVGGVVRFRGDVKLSAVGTKVQFDSKKMENVTEGQDVYNE